MIDPDEPLRTYIDQLYVGAGMPSVRTIAGDRRVACSHTTVHAVLRYKGQAGIEAIEEVVAALGGDPAHARDLWTEAALARRAASGPASTLAFLSSIDTSLKRIADALEAAR